MGWHKDEQEFVWTIQIYEIRGKNSQEFWAKTINILCFIVNRSSFRNFERNSKQKVWTNKELIFLSEILLLKGHTKGNEYVDKVATIR